MIHNTRFSQFLPCMGFHIVTGTWTQVAGQVAGTICWHKAAAAETATVTVPIEIPSNSGALNGAKLASVELDYQILVAAVTTLTPVINLVTRGIDTAVAVVAAQTYTQAPNAAGSVTVDKHKLVLTITTPFWLLNTQYVLVQFPFICPGTTTLDILGAVANFTFRA